jgi:hypothetical protein
MTTDQNDLTWLQDSQPTPLDPTATVTEHRRAEFTSWLAEQPADAPAEPTPIRAAHRRRPVRVVAYAVAAAVAVTVGVVSLHPTDDHAVSTAPSVASLPAPGRAAPLMQLASDIQSQPLPTTGDATLVEHTNVVSGGQTFSGNDLYLDDGRYFFGQTRAELANVSITQTDQVDPDVAAEVRTAARAADLTPAVGRQAMLDAVPVPGLKPDGTLDTALIERNARADAPVIAKKIQATKEAAAKAGVAAQTITPHRPRTAREIQTNYLWLRLNDALAAGQGRPEVRAGVLRILATMPEVKVAKATEHGVPVLQLTNGDFEDGYTETLAIDAATGVLLHFEGGSATGEPGVSITYAVSRVTAAQVLKP